MENHKLLNITAEEQNLSDALKEIIISDIKQSPNERISFRHYMELALYHPIYGYYNNWRYKFGSSGDYITASGVSGLFGETLAKQIEELFVNNVTPCVLEFGAGNGQLMLDIMAHIGQKIDKYYILELSPSLAKVQQNVVKQKFPQYLNKLVWLNSLPNCFDGVVIANEVLDANPCELITIIEQNIYSQDVAYIDGEFSFVNTPANQEIINEALKLPKHIFAINGYTTEINLLSQALVKSISQILQKGAVFFIDYGYGENEFYSASRIRGTLRGFFRQQLLDNVLIYPGLIDITSSVNFSAIAASGIAHGLDMIGYVSQANFLINCEVLDSLKFATTEDSDYLAATNKLNYLLSPNEMGEVFKVIAFSKNLDFFDFQGFISGDKTYTL